MSRLPAGRLVLVDRVVLQVQCQLLEARPIGVDHRLRPLHAGAQRRRGKEAEIFRANVAK